MSLELVLNNGVPMPPFGLGVFQSPPDETAAAVDTALRAGYRHVDTAAYGNEREVGDGIRRSCLAREDVFIETKVWVSNYGRDTTLHAWEKSSRKLGVEQIERLMDAAAIVPAVNQIELHPYNTQSATQKADADLGIPSQAWSPIGGITFYPEPWGGERRSVMQDETITAIADAHGKSTAQVMIRWHLQQGRSAIPTSTTPGRIVENFDAFDFEPSPDDLARSDALDPGRPSGPEPEREFGEQMLCPIPEV